MNYLDILQFWFEEITPQAWWKKDLDFDSLVKRRFSEIHAIAIQGELFEWRSSIQGRLAEIIVLDQFSRNMFRDQPESFLYDPLALGLAQEAVQSGLDQDLIPQQRQFLFMPYMHSESLRIHEEAVKLFNDPELGSNYEFELKHKAIIDRFGRYPHRNAILRRTSTKQELEFLKTPGSSF